MEQCCLEVQVLIFPMGEWHLVPQLWVVSSSPSEPKPVVFIGRSCAIAPKNSLAGAWSQGGQALHREQEQDERKRPQGAPGRLRLDIRENSIQKALSSPGRGCPGQCGVTSPGKAQKRFGNGT